MKAQFWGVKAEASGVGRGWGDYRPEYFAEDFPQFFTPASEDEPSKCLVPSAVLAEFIEAANAAITPERWPGGGRYACGLYVAHQATLYLRTWAESSPDAAGAASTGALVGVVKSATLGDSSVSYDTEAITRATADWGDLNATQYGQQLAARARLAGMGGSYAI